jgi:hypothetical protein
LNVRHDAAREIALILTLARRPHRDQTPFTTLLMTTG